MKPEDQRVDFEVVFESGMARRAKDHLATYKSQYRGVGQEIEWRGRFEMRISKDTLKFRFHNAVKLNYEIVEGVKGFQIKDSVKQQKHTLHDPLMQSYDDKELGQLLIMEGPSVVVANLMTLSDETRAYFADPNLAEPTALINILKRRNYSWEVDANILRVRKDA